MYLAADTTLAPFFTSSSPVINFPNGPVLASDLHQVFRYYGPLVSRIRAPSSAGVSPAQRDAFVQLNYLMRPPLTDAEIRCLPLADVVTLYYSLRMVTGCGDQYRYNPVVSRGLPAPWADTYEIELRNRIYALRPELTSIQDSTGKAYRILLPGYLLDAPTCGPQENLEAIQAISSFISIFTFGFSAIIAAIATAVIQAGTTAATVMQNRTIVDQINKAQGIAKEVAIGTALARVSPQSAPDAGDLAYLGQQASNWRRAVAYFQASASSILSAWRVMPFPEQLLALLYDPQLKTWSLGRPGVLDDVEAYLLHGVRPPQVNLNAVQAFVAAGERYAASWSPSDFFYSASVARMVAAPDQAASVMDGGGLLPATLSGGKPDPVGLGLLALLFLI